jgi:hypothetical protein
VSLVGLDKAGEVLLASARETSDSRSCLWPAPYDQDTPEALLAFIFDHCETWDEATGEIRRIPDHEYLQKLGREWFATMKSGQPFGDEKSRRLVVSWFFCAADVWDGGRRRANIVQGGIDYDKASDFVWRCWFIYDRLRRRNPQWRLPKQDKWGNEKAQRLDKLAFANGTVIEPLNSNGESFRGSGYTRVKLEELSAYRYVGQVFSQAKAVTMGPPGMVGGHVVFVCNASANPEWQELKKEPPPEDGETRKNPADEPYKAYNALSGARVVRVHYSADPEKTPEWAAKERVGWYSAEWQREMELHDKDVTGALWSYELLERCRIDRLPENKVMAVIGVDPSISDPEKVKNPSKQPDECGIIAGYLLDDARAVIVNDLSAVMSPNQWATVSVKAYSWYKANKIAAEDNQGGEMVRLTIQSVGPAVPIELVHASLGKRARAEPAVALYEQGRVLHYWPKGGPNPLAKLEHEQCTWDASNPSARSPNRVDALVILLHAMGLCQATGARRYSRMEHDREDDD